MIINALLDVVYTLMSLLTAPISIPGMPEEVQVFVYKALEYIAMGIKLLSNYTDLNYLFMLFGVIVAIDAGLLIYKFAMWIIKKIPMLGIS